MLQPQTPENVKNKIMTGRDITTLTIQPGVGSTQPEPVPAPKCPTDRATNLAITTLNIA